MSIGSIAARWKGETGAVRHVYADEGLVVVALDSGPHVFLGAYQDAREGDRVEVIEGGKLRRSGGAL